MNDTPISRYPDLRQSIGITLILMISGFVFPAVTYFLKKWISPEFRFFIEYILGFGIPLIYFNKYRKKLNNTNSYNISTSHYKIIPLVMLASISLLIGISSPLVNLIPMSDFIKHIMHEVGALKGILMFFVGVIIAPILEEIIYRGIILDGLLKIYSPFKAIIISSVLFSVLHLNPWQATGALLGGMLSGWIYYKSGNLILSIIIHASNNLYGFIIINYFSADVTNHRPLTEYYGSLTNYIAIIVIAIITFGTAMYFLKNYFTKHTAMPIPAIDLA
jgi:uncharacterized protein